MSEEKKPFVHELKAHDFILEPPTLSMAEEWHDRASFPQDGHVVEVRAQGSPEIARALWNTVATRIELEPGSKLAVTQVHEWREFAPWPPKLSDDDDEPDLDEGEG